MSISYGGPHLTPTCVGERLPRPSNETTVLILRKPFVAKRSQGGYYSAAKGTAKELSVIEGEIKSESPTYKKLKGVIKTKTRNQEKEGVEEEVVGVMVVVVGVVVMIVIMMVEMETGIAKEKKNGLKLQTRL